MLKVKWIDGYKGIYKITSAGDVISYKLGKKRCLSRIINSCGYEQVGLSKNGVVKIKLIHRLLGEAFLKKRKGANMINHKDGVKSNNALENLEWCTAAENIRHMFKVLKYPNGMQGKTGKLHHASKPVKSIDNFGNVVLYESILQAAKAVQAQQSNIRAVLLNRRKTAAGYRWMLA